VRHSNGAGKKGSIYEVTYQITFACKVTNVRFFKKKKKRNKSLDASVTKNCKRVKHG